MNKKSLRDVINAIQKQPKADFKNMTSKELLHFRFVEMSKEDYKRLSDEFRKRGLIQKS